MRKISLYKTEEKSGSLTKSVTLKDKQSGIRVTIRVGKALSEVIYPVRAKHISGVDIVIYEGDTLCSLPLSINKDEIPAVTGVLSSVDKIETAVRDAIDNIEKYI